MNDNKYLKILSVLGFLAFAAVSCWATSESLHLLLPDLPLAFCWVVTIGFFIIASWGTKMVADSLNQDLFIDNRKPLFWGGIAIVAVFWLLCSMPTNTHTFFFRNLINDCVTTDLATTQGYLGQIKSGEATQTKIRKKQAEVENKINTLLQSLESEIKAPNNPGDGPETKKVLAKIAQELGVAEIPVISGSVNTEAGRDAQYKAYRKMVLTMLENKKANIEKQLTPSGNQHKVQAEKEYKALENVKKYIANEQISLTDANDVKNVCDQLNRGYSAIKTYQDFVDFKTEGDKETYTCDNPETKVKRLLSVYDVWVDFLTGKAGGLSFLFWILISVLVDIAAFIFFDIAFKKR